MLVKKVKIAMAALTLILALLEVPSLNDQEKLPDLVAGDGKVFLASDAGVVIVLKAGPRFEVLAEFIRATPALVDGKIYLRTAGHLYAFGE